MVKDIKEVLGLNGGILDLEITSNRPDCLSILGLAREVSAVYGAPLKKPDFTFNPQKSDVDPVKVSIDTPLSRRYMAREVVDVVIGESPDFIKSRL